MLNFNLVLKDYVCYYNDKERGRKVAFKERTIFL